MLAKHSFKFKVNLAIYDGDENTRFPIQRSIILQEPGRSPALSTSDHSIQTHQNVRTTIELCSSKK